MTLHSATVVLFILLQVRPPLPRPLPLLQRLFQPQETAGEDAAGSVDASWPQRCLLLVKHFINQFMFEPLTLC